MRDTVVLPPTEVKKEAPSQGNIRIRSLVREVTRGRLMLCHVMGSDMEGLPYFKRNRQVKFPGERWLANANERRPAKDGCSRHQ